MNRAGAYVAIGGNLPHPGIGPPATVLRAAVAALPDAGVRVLRRSRWYRSAPVPPSAQPDYLNGVLEVECELSPGELLEALQRIEWAFDRVRGEANAARTLDLDLLAYGGDVVDRPPHLIVPHPRLHVRAFVLIPLVELAPAWRHPLLCRTAEDLLADLPDDGGARPSPESDETAPPERDVSASPDATAVALQPGGERA